MNGDVRLSAQELTVTVGGLPERVDFCRSQRPVGMHVETYPLRSDRAAGHRHELTVYERHPYGWFAGAGNDSRGVENPARVLVAAVGLVEDLQQMSSRLRRGPARWWGFARCVPIGPAVVLEAFQPALRGVEAAPGITEREAGPIGKIPFGRWSVTARITQREFTKSLVAIKPVFGRDAVAEPGVRVLAARPCDRCRSARPARHAQAES